MPSSSTQSLETGSSRRGQLAPKSTVNKEVKQPFRKGFLVAKREGFSFATNSIGPLWILEIADPGAKDNGRLVRCFNRIPESIMMGNSSDDVPPVWFRISRMLRPDGARIEVAIDLTTDKPGQAG